MHSKNSKASASVQMQQAIFPCADDQLASSSPFQKRIRASNPLAVENGQGRNNSLLYQPRFSLTTRGSLAEIEVAIVTPERDQSGKHSSAPNESISITQL